MGDGMDNYQLAMMGVKIASKILHINAPEVRFFIIDDLYGRLSKTTRYAGENRRAVAIKKNSSKMI